MEPVRKRRRPAMSCAQCRLRKVRCNRENPCSNCSRTKNTVCDYTDVHSQARPVQHGAQTNLGLDVGSPRVATSDAPSGMNRASVPPPTQPAASPAFSTVSTTVPPVVTTTTFTGLNDAFYVHYEQENSDSTAVDAPPPHPIPRCVAHKTRLFGQSHWVSPCITLFRDLIDLMSRSAGSLASAEIERCKSLARIIKARRSPPWPTIPTRELPLRDLADALVDRYLQTTETLYRVLHIPSFRQSYDALWDSADAGEQPPMGFIIQVKLVLAIGATTYDDDFSLRTTAIGWIHEALTWNSSPAHPKSRLTVQGIQNHILLLIAQDLVGVGRDMVWPSTGSLVRIAMHMGLHRDPSRLQPSATLFAAEMRRRLWNTILELTLQSSLDAGGAPLISLADFDTLPPSNYSDADLSLVLDKPPSPFPLTDLTETTASIAFRKTLLARLSIVRHLNGLSSTSTSPPYQTTISLDSDLRSSYLSLSQTLRNHGPSFGILYLDLLVHRYLAALHIPFLAPALDLGPAREPGTDNQLDNSNNNTNTKFLYSRTSALSASLRIWSISTASPLAIFTRFVTNGATFLRASSTQAIFAIAAELRAQLIVEHASLVPAPMAVRPDLAAILEEAENWSLRCIEAGETNVKGYLFVCLIRAQIEALRAGMGEDEIPGVLARVTEEAGGKCVELLERMSRALGRDGEEGGEEGGTDDVGFQMASEEMSGLFFGFESAEVIDWELF
ncbi:hypothetical protein QBC34DRAFT_380898 [Podospora aff. communis PSN243]|uniref:Zn(2)-C6 fungal-type domain-containing protein n=1 Tax=Podospora aff. communis PSN243 TaxID=3040156 RepID=A0AAV9GIT2_9PEZI|nr:hypothetical protein QBC34DRAFT_380898 [Podospora aff. communis PSN243]